MANFGCMKMRGWLFSLLLATVLTIWLAGANSAPAAPAQSAAEAATSRLEITASAQVVPVWVSALSFPIAGPLKEVLVRTGDRVEAGQPLAMLDLPELAFNVRQAEFALQAAQVDWEYYRILRKNKPPERRQQAQDRLAAAQAALEVARLTQAQSTLTAPRAATVTEVRLKTGEFAGVGQTVLILADLDDFQVQTTDLSERNVAAIRPGQKAMIYIDALNREFPARVVRVAPRAKKKDGDVLFTVTLAFASPPTGLRWGMSAEVTFTE